MRTRRRFAVPLDSEQQYIALMKWMKLNGFKSSKLLKPANFPDTGRGMMAVRKIHSGDCLLSIPRKLLITTTTVLESSLGLFINMWTQPKLTPRQILAVFLVYEKYCNILSIWKPYLESLPESYNVPAFWRETPRHTSPLLKQKITRHIQEVRDAYESCQPFLEHLSNILPAFRSAITYEQFLWGWFTVHTRAVHFEQAPKACLAPERDHYALAPYLDLLNHCPNAKVKDPSHDLFSNYHVLDGSSYQTQLKHRDVYTSSSCGGNSVLLAILKLPTIINKVKAAFNEVTEHYEIIILNSCRKYDQIFINYGPRDNSTLLVDYGFVANDNPHNIVEFTIDELYCAVEVFTCRSQPEWIKKQLHILGEQNLIRDLTCSFEGPSWNFLVVLRILLMKQAELENWSLALCDKLSPHHQQAVKSCSRICVENKLRTYPPEDLHNSSDVGDKLVTLLMKQEVDILKASLNHIEIT